MRLNFTEIKNLMLLKKNYKTGTCGDKCVLIKVLGFKCSQKGDGVITVEETCKSKPLGLKVVSLRFKIAG